MTFSYIDNLWTSAIGTRRMELQRSKQFVCHCARCDAPDDCRGVRCPVCSRGLAFPRSTQEGEEWVCRACGVATTGSAFVRTERAIESEVDGLLRTMQVGGLGRIHPCSFVRLAERAAALLSPMHRLVAVAYEHEALLCVSHAVALDRIGAPAKVTVQLRSQAALAGAAAVAAVECMAADCREVTDCMGSHEAVHECAALAFNAGQDLLHVPLVAHEPTVREALLFVVKYVPAMRILHGSDDADVQEVCGRVEHVAQSQVSTKKKKKGRTV